MLNACSDTAGTTIVNQVQRTFNGLGQLTIEYQEHYGAVDVDSSLYVQWTYVEMSGGANNSRLLSLTYPNGKEVDYNYASGLDDTISRLTSMSDSSFTLEDYTYLGLGTVVQRNHDQTGVDLTYIKLTGESNGDAGDKYIGLDRFGRVVDQRWLDDTDTDVDRYQYTYDRNSNRLSRSNLTTTGLDETYTYDNLNQIADFYLDSTLTQNWVYDAVGNWQSVTTSGTIQGRRHNRLNEITTITGATTPAYDDNGNTITDDNNLSYVYDAWNMPVTVLDSDEDVLESFVYDALSRRIQEIDADSDITDIYYSAAWQNLEERLDGEVAAQYLWSPVYIDCMVYRDRSVSGTLDERFYVTQDANFNATAIVDTTGTVQERYAYTPFGVASYFDGSWGSISSSEYGWIYLFQGGRLDGVTGNVLFRMRELRPPLGRWMTNDPLLASASYNNPYMSYANSPLNLTDPIGLEPDINSSDLKDLFTCEAYLYCKKTDAGVVESIEVSLGDVTHTHCTLIVGHGSQWIAIDGAGRSTVHKDAPWSPIPSLVWLSALPDKNKYLSVSKVKLYPDDMLPFCTTCADMIKCLINAYETIPQAPYDYYNNNSNTYVYALMRACDLSVSSVPTGARAWQYGSYPASPRVDRSKTPKDIYKPTPPVGPNPHPAPPLPFEEGRLQLQQQGDTIGSILGGR